MKTDLVDSVKWFGRPFSEVLETKRRVLLAYKARLYYQ